MTSAWPIGSRSFVLCVVVAGALAVMMSDRAGAVIDDPDVDTFAAYEYRIDPEQGAVDVTIELTVTADKPNRYLNDGSYYEYYVPGYVIAVPKEAVDLAVTDQAGRSLRFTTSQEDQGFTIVEVDFRRNIFYRQTADVVVTYRLPEGRARSETPARVNRAYAGFSVWLTPQIENASVTVISPPGFEDRGTGTDRFEARPGDDQIAFVAEDVDPELFWAVVSLARDDALATTELTIDGNRIEIKAWPGDDGWTEHVISNIEDGLPVLIDTVGLPWPIDDELSIIESYSPYLQGYAGWYDPATEEIEIGDELDSHLVFHELTHVWFNDDLFRHRWITEGLADVFGAAVVDELGEERPSPTQTSPGRSVAIPLNRWTQFDPNPELEEWAYNASWTVTEALREEVGLEALAQVVQAAAGREIAYLGDGEPEAGPRQSDWRVYLDLIENRSGVNDDAIVDLFEEWVVRDTSRPVLSVRAEHRDRYDELRTVGDGWAPPIGVREAMAEWQFDDAGERIDDAMNLLDRRTYVHELLEPLDAKLPAEVESVYEAAGDDMSDVSSLMTKVETAADGLRRSHESVEAVSGPVRWVGALGTDYRADLAQAIDRFERGDLDRAVADSETIEAGVDDLHRQGLIRIVIVAAVLIVLIGLTALLIARRRRRRRSGGGGGAGGVVGGGGAGDSGAGGDGTGQHHGEWTGSLALPEGVPVGELGGREPLGQLEVRPLGVGHGEQTGLGVAVERDLQ